MSEALLRARATPTLGIVISSSLHLPLTSFASATLPPRFGPLFRHRGHCDVHHKLEILIHSELYIRIFGTPSTFPLNPYSCTCSRERFTKTYHLKPLFPASRSHLPSGSPATYENHQDPATDHSRPLTSPEIRRASTELVTGLSSFRRALIQFLARSYNSPP